MKMRNILVLFCTLFLISCNKNILTTRKLKNNKYKIEDVSSINLSGKIAFRPHTGVLLVDSSEALPYLITFLKKNKSVKIDIIVYHFFGSERFYMEGLIESGNLRDYLVLNGIDSSRIIYKTMYDKKNKFKYTSVYRKVEIIVKK